MPSGARPDSGTGVSPVRSPSQPETLARPPARHSTALRRASLSFCERCACLWPIPPGLNFILPWTAYVQPPKLQSLTELGNGVGGNAKTPRRKGVELWMGGGLVWASAESESESVRVSPTFEKLKLAAGMACLAGLAVVLECPRSAGLEAGPTSAVLPWGTGAAAAGLKTCATERSRSLKC